MTKGNWLLQASRRMHDISKHCSPRKPIAAWNPSFLTLYRSIWNIQTCKWQWTHHAVEICIEQSDITAVSKKLLWISWVCLVNERAETKSYKNYLHHHPWSSDESWMKVKPMLITTVNITRMTNVMNRVPGRTIILNPQRLAETWWSSRKTALKDKRPPRNMSEGVFRYQASGGISLTCLFMGGAWNSGLQWCPISPPNASRGTARSAYMRTITTIVPKGRAAVDW